MIQNVIPPVGSCSFGNISWPHIVHTAAAVTSPPNAVQVSYRAKAGSVFTYQEMCSTGFVRVQNTFEFLEDLPLSAVLCPME